MTTPTRLFSRILSLAIQGKLVSNHADDSVDDLLKEIAANNSARKKSKSEPISDDQIPFQIPDNWKWVRLGEICEIGTGSTPSKNNPNYYNGVYNWINSSATSNKYIDEPNAMITELALKETNCKVYPIGSLIMAMYGEGKTRGQISELRIEAATNQACCAIMPINKDTKEYIYYFFIYNYNNIRKLAEGGAQPNLNMAKVKSLLLPLPPLSVQSRIVSKLNEIKALVDECEDIENGLEKDCELLRKKVLDLAIRGRLTTQLPSDGDAQSLIDKISAEKAKSSAKNKKQTPPQPITPDDLPFQIPVNWKWVRLGEIITLLSGRDLEPNKYNSNNNGIPYMTGASNFNNNQLIINRWTESPVTISHKGDLLITCKGTIGEMAFNEIGDIHIARQIMGINSTHTNLHYIKFFLKANLPKLQIAANSMIPGISRDVLLETLFPLPPLAEQHRIVEALENIFAKIDNLRA